MRRFERAVLMLPVTALLAGCASGAVFSTAARPTAPRSPISRVPVWQSTMSQGQFTGPAPVTTPPSATPSQIAALPTAHYLGPITAATTVGQFEYDPPPAGYQPRVNWSTAYAACADGGTVCGNDGGPSIVLALVTSSAIGETNGGNTIFTFQDRPTYVFTWVDNDCQYVPAGPVAAPGQSLKPAVIATHCVTTTFVDADTGRGLYSVQTASP